MRIVYRRCVHVSLDPEKHSSAIIKPTTSRKISAKPTISQTLARMLCRQPSADVLIDLLLPGAIIFCANSACWLEQARRSAQTQRTDRKIVFVSKIDKTNDFPAVRGENMGHGRKTERCDVHKRLLTRHKQRKSLFFRVTQFFSRFSGS